MTLKHGSINSSYEVIEGKTGTIFKKFFEPSRLESFWRELKFYQWCSSNNIKQVPSLLEFDELNLVLTISFINGGSSPNCSGEIIEDIKKFLVDLNRNRVFDSMLNASEGVLKAGDLLANIDSRLMQVGLTGKYHPKSLLEMIDAVRNYLTKEPPDIGGLLISPSDLGVHNCLQSDRLYFFDFEYAGVYSKLKLIFDYVLHPANNIESGEMISVAMDLSRALPEDNFIVDPKLFPPFCLWWILRTINSLSDVVLKRRVKAQLLERNHVGSYVESRVTLIEKFTKDFYEFNH